MALLSELRASQYKFEIRAIPGVQTQEGAYLEADLPIAGFGLIQAANLQEAIKLASESPCAVAHGVIEVWPLDVAINS